MALCGSWQSDRHEIPVPRMSQLPTNPILAALARLGSLIGVYQQDSSSKPPQAHVTLTAPASPITISGGYARNQSPLTPAQSYQRQG